MLASVTVAVLGTGIMGYPMARRLCGAGFSVNVWNRTLEKAKPLEAYGCKVAHNPCRAVEDAQIVIGMMSDKSAADLVYFKLDTISAMSPDSLLIEMATMAPDETIELARAVTAHGKRFIDAPVSGGEKGAIEGNLNIMVGGAKDDFADANLLFAALGHATHVGPVGSGAVTKLCNQMIVGNTVIAVAEALNLSRKMGANPTAVHQALRGGFADSVILREHGQRMLNENFTPGGPAKYMLDILLAAEEVAKKNDTFLPLVQVSKQLFETMITKGRGDQDISGVISELSEVKNNS